MSERDAALSLLSAGAVRERAAELLAAGLEGKFRHFTVDLARLNSVADFVADVVRENYPDLNVPLHSRWRHFVVGGHDLWAELARNAQWPDAPARARAEFDLAIMSVLLDAGAGGDWRYRDAATGITVGRSEGLALASLRMFEAGLFSSDARDPLRVDADRLAAHASGDLANGFQTGANNTLAGLDGRAALLARLGRTMLANPGVFAKNEAARPGGLFDQFAELAGDRSLPAPDILHELLIHLAPIWPDRLMLGGVSLGDCWRHQAIKRDNATDGLMPLHKLSQWLSYSLIEPLQTAGVAVTDIDGLTGLAEYRNGGLFVDAGVLTLRDQAQGALAHPVDSELVVEWRALTVALLDRLLPLVHDALGVGPRKFPLGSLLEGGTWAAGRKIAREKRGDGSPPLTVTSDGTVF
jgi:Protein of unknown function (DUF1688)